MAKKKKIDLEEFTCQLRADAERFQLYYKKMQAECPEHFPISMDMGDWYGQFESFNSTGEH